MKKNITLNFGSFAGFTLAEMIIVIGIIGIIAEATIPTLVQNFQEKTTVVTLKKAYSTLSSAYTLAVQENGTPDNWGLISMSSPEGGENILNKMAPYLMVTKNCGRNSGCFSDSNKRLNGGSFVLNAGAQGTAQLADGSFIYTWSAGSCSHDQGESLALKTHCGDIGIDINGFKKPNQLGVDIFTFYLTKYGIVPCGAQQSYVTSLTFDNDCRNKSTGNGWGCAAWVIYNENMDYLHCNDLSWSSKTKCD